MTDRWWLDEPLYMQNRKAINDMLSVLVLTDESQFTNFKEIWTSMNRLFSHKYAEKLIMMAISESRFWPLLLDGLK